MLAIVGSIAALVLTVGLNSVIDFHTFLVDVDNSENFLKERMIINNVDFTPSANTVIISVRNIGLNQLTIQSIAITNIDTQINILLANDPSVNTYVVQAKSKFTTPALATSCTFTPASDCATANYNISIVTDRGNIFENEVIPFRL